MAITTHANVALAERTTLGVGGVARQLIIADSAHDAQTILAQHPDARLIGGGSNLVVDDGVHRRPFVALALATLESRIDDHCVKLSVGAGVRWDQLVKTCVDNDWTGIECLSGIPGYVGAAPMQNIGAYGQQLSDCLSTVRAYDRDDQCVVEFDQASCRFGYRDSLFKAAPDRYAILSVALELSLGKPAPPRYGELSPKLGPGASAAEIRQAVLALRRQKAMVFDPAEPDSRSAGSFFTNPLVEGALAQQLLASDPALPHYPQPDGRVKFAAAALIERAGFVRGHQAGSVGLSSKHALAIVNRGNARASDVVRFAEQIQRAVEAQFAIRLCPEPRFIGEGPLPDLWS